ncbi:MAG: hypothetical protein NDI61_00330 [Bdellovibrionaceae bacterium]|nr:hypothetical protein [Pseudobdellovibrionaceae bacterium]
MRNKSWIAAVCVAVCGSAGVLGVMTPAEAAVSKKDVLAQKVERVSMRKTQEALNLPMVERISRLRSQGPAGYRNLVEIMFDEQAKMDERWKAVTAAGRIGGKDARPEIDRALKHEVWFMRNAGLIAARAIDREAALKAARQLITDKALVVRASAVDTISELSDPSATDLLWKQLHSSQNFKGGQSLYVRIKIAEALARLEKPGREDKFIALLAEKETEMHAPALFALERLTRKTIGPADGSVGERRAAWLKWWKANKG